MAGKGGGAWKVAYADFVTAMMAFFMVMWITAQSKSVKQAVSQYFSDPHGSSKMPSGVSTKTAGGTSVFPTHRAGDAPFVRGGKGAKGHGTGAADLNLKRPPEEEVEEIHTKKPNLFIMQMGNRSLMGATVQFSETSADLDEWAKSRLKAVSPLFLGKPHKIEIRGHAIRKPTTGAGISDAWQLSYARCIATMKYLEEQGVEAERFRLSQAGAYEPYSQRGESEWQGQNSRVDVYMIGEFIDEAKPGAKREGPKSRTLDPKEHGTADASGHSEERGATPHAPTHTGG